MYASAHLSLLADLSLGAILIFLWVIRRSDRHALYWGSGQILLGLSAGIWSLGLPGHLPLLLIALLCCGGAAAYVAGSQHFCARPAFWGRSLLGGALVFLLGSLFPLGDGQPRYAAAPLVLSLAFAWSARCLLQRPHAYRILGILFALRAANNFALTIEGALNQGHEFTFLFGFLLKMASMLGLIHAVLHENDQRIRAVLDGLGHGFLIRDEQGAIHFASQKLAGYLGEQDARALIGRHVSSLVPSRTPEQTVAWFRQITAPGAVLPGIDEALHVRKDGAEFPVEIISVPFDDRGQLRVLSQVIDIRKRKEQEAALQRAAMLDEATGLFNRSALRQMLGELLDASAASGRCTLLLLIDLDHFRRINETLGHSVGDQLLRQVAARLQALQGVHDVLARFGGDEFVLVVPDLTPADASQEAERLARAILATLTEPFPLDPFRIALKASIGIALGPAHGRNPEYLLSAADTALHAAKDAGRNRHSLFEERMSASARDALLIDEALQQAIAHGEFRLHYQPIVDARSRRLRKVEALLRWHAPGLGNVSPDRFIPIAEESGQIVQIGSWVLQETARQARNWSGQAGAPTCISVNVSAHQMSDPAFLQIVEGVIADSGIPPGMLEIEMTERVLIDEADAVIRVIEALHAKGLSTSLDDFGTGYSSLSYLTRFHLRTLKIDRAFVSGIEHDERKLDLVRAIIAMGHSLGMQIVAEGVETEAQAEILAGLGCEYLQGWLISRALPAEELRFDAPAGNPQ